MGENGLAMTADAHDAPGSFNRIGFRVQQFEIGNDLRREVRSLESVRKRLDIPSPQLFELVSSISEDFAQFIVHTRLRITQ
jgi:hypothetical protein